MELLKEQLLELLADLVEVFGPLTGKGNKPERSGLRMA